MRTIPVSSANWDGNVSNVLESLREAGNSDLHDFFTLHELYAALANDKARNNLICIDLLRSIKTNRSPILLTERTSQVDEFASRLTGLVKHIVVLKGGMGAKQRRAIAEQLTGIPEGEERVLLATGRYIGEGFDDARLDTLFLAMPVSWRGTLQTLVVSTVFTTASAKSSFAITWTAACLFYPRCIPSVCGDMKR
jgi:superfamily II DNA or RNA helicase